MKRLLMIAAAMSVLLSGCGGNAQQQALNFKTMQKTVGQERMVQLLAQVGPPSMDPSIMKKSDEELVTWIKQLDLYTSRVLSAPLTGEVDSYGATEIRNKLREVFTYDCADDLIAYFYRHDPTTNTYQAYSDHTMLGLRSEWLQYQVGRAQPSPDVYTITITGLNNQFKNGMMHRSMYRVENGKLVVTQFETAS